MMGQVTRTRHSRRSKLTVPNQPQGLPQPSPRTAERPARQGRPAPGRRRRERSRRSTGRCGPPPRRRQECCHHHRRRRRRRRWKEQPGPARFQCSCKADKETRAARDCRRSRAASNLVGGGLDETAQRQNRDNDGTELRLTGNRGEKDHLIADKVKGVRAGGNVDRVGRSGRRRGGGGQILSGPATVALHRG